MTEEKISLNMDETKFIAFEKALSAFWDRRLPLEDYTADDKAYKETKERATAKNKRVAFMDSSQIMAIVFKSPELEEWFVRSFASLSPSLEPKIDFTLPLKTTDRIVDKNKPLEEGKENASMHSIEYIMDILKVMKMQSSMVKIKVKLESPCVFECDAFLFYLAPRFEGN